jgi:hypothetical protein
MKVNLKNIQEIGKGDEKFTLKSVDLLIKLFSDGLRNMQKYSRRKQWDKVGAEAHKVKPCFRIIGIREMEARFSNIEENARKAVNLNEMPAFLHEAAQLCMSIIEELKEVRQSLANRQSVSSFF